MPSNLIKSFEYQLKLINDDCNFGTIGLIFMLCVLNCCGGHELMKKKKFIILIAGHAFHSDLIAGINQLKMHAIIQNARTHNPM